MTVTSFLILRAIITYAVDIDIDIDIGKADIDRPLPVSERANILMSVNTTFARKSCPTSIKRRAFIVCPMLCMDRIYIYLCVSVTLSVNSPTDQTPQRIFTVDSLKDGGESTLDLCYASSEEIPEL